MLFIKDSSICTQIQNMDSPGKREVDKKNHAKPFSCFEVDLTLETP